MVNKTTASESVLVQVSWESEHGFPGTKQKALNNVQFDQQNSSL